MFEPDSYLVHPPVNFEPKQKICLQAIALAMRAALQAMTTIKNVTAELDLTGMPTQHQLIELYSRTWTVIDQVHMIRALLRVLNANPNPGTMKRFLDDYEAVHAVRNKMDHLQQNLANLANSKDERPMVFGSLSYFRFDGIEPNEHGDKIFRGKIVVVPFGATTHEAHAFPMTNPAGRSINKDDKTALFEFSSFGHTILIYKLFDDLPALASHLDRTAKQQFDAWAERTSKATGLSIQELTKRPQSILFFMDLEAPLGEEAPPSRQP